MNRWLREPLLWFALLGGVLFWLDRTGEPTVAPVVVSDAVRSRLADQWQAQMGQPPTAKELDGLIEGWIREEVYAREAMAMGLDQNDTIIRRRLVQKLTFLTEDLATAQAPEEEALRSFYAAEQARYREPARYSFEHRYFNSDERQDPRADAAAALDTLTKEPAAPIGDPFMLQLTFANRSVRQIGDLFGKPFAAALEALPSNRWQGPIASAYGQHLVRVTATVPERIRPFAEARQRVAIDYAQAQRREASDRFYQSLRDRYPVVIEAATP